MAWLTDEVFDVARNYFSSSQLVSVNIKSVLKCIQVYYNTLRIGLVHTYIFLY